MTRRLGLPRVPDAPVEPADQGGVVLGVVERLGRAVELELAHVLFGRVELGVEQLLQQAAFVVAQWQLVLEVLPIFAPLSVMSI
jgi:hypothetical protein